MGNTPSGMNGKKGKDSTKDKKASHPQKLAGQQPSSVIVTAQQLPPSSTLSSTSSSAPLAVISISTPKADHKLDAKQATIPYEPRIFTEKFQIPTERPVELNKPIEETAYLALLYRELLMDSKAAYRRGLLENLALQVVEQFAQRSIKTPSLLDEIIALGPMPNARVIKKILNHFLEILNQSADLDVDVLQALAQFLERVDLRAFEEKVVADEDADEKAHSLVSRAAKAALKDVGAVIQGQDPSHLSSVLGEVAERVGERALTEGKAVVAKGQVHLKVLKTKATAALSSLSATASVTVSNASSSSVNSLSSSAISSHSSSGSSSMIHIDAAFFAEHKREVKLAVDVSDGGFSNVNLLVQIMKRLLKLYNDFHAQPQNQKQRAEWLRVFGRVLDGMCDLNVMELNEESLRNPAYQQLLALANAEDSELSVELSIRANYALQALIRVPQNKGLFGEILARGQSLLNVVSQLKQFWNDWDTSRLSSAYGSIKTALHLDHQPQLWYDALRFCQIAIHAGCFQDLEEYLYRTDETGIPFLLQRYEPAFQLGLMTSLDEVIHSTRWPLAIKKGCLVLLQQMFLQEDHWYFSEGVSQSIHSAGWMEKAKNSLLYFNRSYQKEWAQKQLLKLLVGYLSDGELRIEAQALLLEIRESALSERQRKLVDRQVPKFFELIIIKPKSAVVVKNELLTAAKREAERSLPWKIESMRTKVLSDEYLQRELSAYVHPDTHERGREKPEDRVALLADTLYFLGLTQESPTTVQKVLKMSTTAGEESSEDFNDQSESVDDESENIETKGRSGKLVDAEALSSISASSSAMPPGALSAEPAPTQPLAFPRDHSWQEEEDSENEDRPSIPAFFHLGSRGPSKYPRVDKSLSESLLAAEWTVDSAIPIRDSESKTKPVATAATAAIAFSSVSVSSASSLLSRREVSTTGDQKQEVKDQRDVKEKKTELKEEEKSVMNLSQPPVSTESAVIVAKRRSSIANAKPLSHADGRVGMGTILLLLGGAGSGKSTFGRYLMKYLWEHYEQGGYIPLWISLSTAKSLDHHLIEKELEKEWGFNAEQIKALKNKSSDYRFIFILDGLDEANVKINLFQKNALHEWPGCKVMITSRPEYLTGDYMSLFTSSRADQRSTWLRERWVAAFDESQIAEYLQRYVKQAKAQAEHEGTRWLGWDRWEDYQLKIQSIPGLKDLVSNPFMLKIIIDVLPDMLRQRQEAQESVGDAALTRSDRIRRIDLYRSFVQQWFDRAAGKCTQVEIKEAKRTNTDLLYRFQAGGKLQEDYQDFSEDLAAYLFRNKQQVAIYQIKWQMDAKGRKPQPQDLDQFFSEHDLVVSLLRKGCPLQKQASRYGFVHKSLWEFFTAMRIYREILLGKVPWPQQVIPQEMKTLKRGKTKWDEKVIQMRQRLADKQMSQSSRVTLAADYKAEDLLINQRLLTDEPSIIQFLAQLAEEDPDFRKKLMYWMLCSRDKETISIASANAFTILNVARFPFSGLDLSRIRAPGADLSYGLFDHTNLSKADLPKVNFDNAFLRGVQFANSNLENIFLEINTGQPVDCSTQAVIYLSDDKKQLFICNKTTKIQIYDLAVKSYLEPIQCTHKITKILLPANSQLAFFCSKDQIEIYDVAKKEFLDSVQYDDSGIAVSPNSQLVVFTQLEKKQRDIKLCVYDVKAKKTIKSVNMEGATFNKTISPNGRLLFLQDEFGGSEIDVFDLVEMMPKDQIACEGHAMVYDGDPQLGRTFALDSSKVFINTMVKGGTFQAIEVCHLTEDAKVTKLIQCQAQLDSVALTPDDSLAMLYSREGCDRVQVYDIKAEVLLPPIVLTERINSISMSAEGSLMLLYGLTHQIQVYNWKTRNFLPVIKLDETIDQVIALTNKPYFCFYGQHSCYIYDLKNKQLSLVRKTTAKMIQVFLLSEREVFIQTEKGAFHSWDCLALNTQRPVSILDNKLEGHTAKINKIHSLGNQFYLTVGDSEVCIWRLLNQKLILEYIFTQTNSVIMISNNTKLLIYNNNEGSFEIQVYDVVHKKLLKPIVSQNQIFDITIDSNDQFAFLHDKVNYLEDENCAVLIYDLRKDKLLTPIVKVRSVDEVRFNKDYSKVYFYHCVGEENDLEAIYDLAIQKPVDHFYLVKKAGMILEKLAKLNARREELLHPAQSKQKLHPTAEELLRKMKQRTDKELEKIPEKIAGLESELKEVTIGLSEADKRCVLLANKIASCQYELSRLQRSKDFSKSKKPMQALEEQEEPEEQDEESKVARGSEEYKTKLNKQTSEKIAELETELAKLTKEIADAHLEEATRDWIILNLEWHTFRCSKDATQQLVRTNDIDRYSRPKNLVAIPKDFSLLGVDFDVRKIMSVEKHLVIPISKEEPKFFAIRGKLPPRDAKKLLSASKSVAILFYGQGGGYIWENQTQQTFKLISGDEITSVILAENGKQLLTAGADCTCRLWDLSGLFFSKPKAPMLKWCSRGLSLYAEQTRLTAGTQLSAFNRQILQKKGAIIEEVVDEKQQAMLSERKATKDQAKLISAGGVSSLSTSAATLTASLSNQSASSARATPQNITSSAQPPAPIVDLNLSGHFS